MAFSGTSTTSLASQIQNYYDKKFLLRAENEMVIEQFAQKRPLPKNQGRTVYFNRYKNLSPKTTPLTEGTLPSVDELSSEKVSAQIAEYGNWTKISKLVAETAIDPDISEKVDIFGYNAAQTCDRLVIEAVSPYATEQVVAGKAHISELTNISDYVITAEEFRKASRTLRVNRAMPVASGYFFAIVSPYVSFDWEGDSDFINAARYAGSEQLYKGELGRWMGIRIIESTEVYREDISGTKDYSNGEVFHTLVFGQQAFGVVPLADGQPRIYVKKPNNNDTSQPIPRYSTVGWLATRAQVILNSNFVVAIKSRATDVT